MEYKLKEAVVIVGIDVVAINKDGEMIRCETPTQKLRDLGKHLVEDLKLYETYEITKIGYFHEYYSLPQIPLRSLLSEITKYFKNLEVFRLSEDIVRLSNIMRKSSLDMIFVCYWPPGMRDGSYYNGDLNFFTGSGGILPIYVGENIISGGIHELIEFYFGKYIWLDKEVCENKECCMYFKPGLGHVESKEDNGLCENCKARIERWITSLKNKPQ